PATQGPASLLAQNKLDRTSRTELQTLWISPHAPSRCGMSGLLLPQSPPLFPSETSPAIHPTALAPRYSSSRLRGLPRAAWLPVGSARCPPPQTATFLAILMSRVPPIYESPARQTAPQFSRNSRHFQPLVLPIRLAPHQLPTGLTPPLLVRDSLAPPLVSPQPRQTPGGSPTFALSGSYNGHRFSS